MLLKDNSNQPAKGEPRHATPPNILPLRKWRPPKYPIAGGQTEILPNLRKSELPSEDRSVTIYLAGPTTGVSIARNFSRIGTFLIPSPIGTASATEKPDRPRGTTGCGDEARERRAGTLSKMPGDHHVSRTILPGMKAGAKTSETCSAAQSLSFWQWPGRCVSNETRSPARNSVKAHGPAMYQIRLEMHDVSSGMARLLDILRRRSIRVLGLSAAASEASDYDVSVWVDLADDDEADRVTALLDSAVGTRVMAAHAGEFAPSPGPELLTAS